MKSVLFLQAGKNIKSLFSDLIDFIYPPFCVICGNYLSREEKDICSSCFENLTVLPEKYCPVCKNFLPPGIEKCHNHSNFSNLDWVYSLGLFDDYYRKIIHAFKYKNKLYLGKKIGKKIGEEVLQKVDLKDYDVIIPVPLHRKRKNKRGFNQSEILAQEIAGKTSLPFSLNGLKRTKNTKDQTTLSREQRRENVQDAFALTKPEQFREKNILLVDDVITTGATLSECAKVLWKNGAKKVSAVTLALSMEI
jgi:competence protein ComFC